MPAIRKLATVPAIALRYAREVLYPTGRTEGARRQFDIFSDVRLRRDRYAYTAHRFLASSQHRLGLLSRPSLKDYARMDDYARETFRIDGAGPVDRVPTDVSEKVYVHDGTSTTLGSLGWGKIVRLGYGVPARPPATPWMIMPYSMHPLIYQRGYDRQIESLRTSSRSMRLFFAGNTDPALYANAFPSMQRFVEHFGLLDRIAALSAVQTGLADRVVRIASTVTLRDVMQIGAHDRLVMVTAGGVRVDQASWLATLAASDFFLAPPGTRMPLCHNIIEAMAVGTIPVTNYPDWFPVPLRDGHDCITFRTPGELVDKTRAILAMPPDAISRMRANVRAYHDAHLCPQRFLDTLLAHPARELSVFVMTEDEDALARVTRDSILFGHQPPGSALPCGSPA